MKTILVFSIIILLSSFVLVNAQDLTITGKINDSQGSALASTSVTLKGNNTYHTKSDKDGNYVLSLPSIGNDTLVFSYISYGEQEVALKDQQTIDVILAESSNDNNQIDLVAYGTRKKDDYPIQIPNAYNGDISIEIPNAYNSDKDISVEIPNAVLKSKKTIIRKLTPEFLPNPKK